MRSEADLELALLRQDLGNRLQHDSSECLVRSFGCSVSIEQDVDVCELCVCGHGLIDKVSSELVVVCRAELLISNSLEVVSVVLTVFYGPALATSSLIEDSWALELEERVDEEVILVRIVLDCHWFNT